jgi:outer membrane protein
MTHGIKTLAFAAMVLLGTSAAMAQSAGTWMVKGGVNRIDPKVKSDDLSAPSLPNSQVDVKSATAAILTLGYMLTDEASLEFYAGLPYKHDIVGAGALSNAGKLGTVKQVSPTLFAQYRFLPAASVWRPYVGIGLTYAHFYGEEGSGTLTSLTNPGGPPTKMSVDSAFGLSPQLGVSFQINDQWYVDGSVIKTFLKNKTTLSTGQSIETKLDPVSTNLSVGYRF